MATDSSSHLPSGGTALVAIVMGSSSDWDVMRHAVDVLREFDVPHTAEVLSAHRMPGDLLQFASGAEKRGLRVIIAGAGGAAHLPGMVAASTLLPVLGVPVSSKSLNGLDSLYSIVQMPRGIPVATFAIGEGGAANAALFAVALLAGEDVVLRERLRTFRDAQTEAARSSRLPV
jgi:5-(carboxyamino)imidazole ribonucleotide mutase